jgi:hypothetical protein
MFSFPSMQSPDDIRRTFNAELRLCNAVTSNAVDVAFRIADLNFCMWKQGVANWSKRSETLELPDAKKLSGWLDASHLKQDLENITTYGQQITKIMLDLQGDLAKFAQQRAITWNATAANTESQAAASAPAPNTPAMAFLQNMVDQASKGYAQWSSSALNAMDAVETDLAHAAAGKDAAPAVKTRSRK